MKSPYYDFLKMYLVMIYVVLSIEIKPFIEMTVGYKWYRTRSIITRSALNITLKVFAGKITPVESILSGNISGKCLMLCYMFYLLDLI